MSRFARGTCCAVVVVLGLVLSAQMSAEESADNSCGVSAGEGSNSSAVERIEAILDQPLTAPLDFTEMPLDEILNVLEEQYDLTIVFDNAALDEVAISPDTEITVNLRNISLRSALTLMLRQPGLEDLTYVIDQEVLLITTRERVNFTTSLEVYRVDDLIEGESTSFNSWDSDYDSLIDTIIATIEHDSWMENGTGKGKIQPMHPGMLVINQTHSVHKMIADLLAKLRATRYEIVGNTHSHENLDLRATRGFAIRVNWGQDAEKEREFFDRSIRQSVDWGPAEAEDAGEVWLRVMPDLILVRHRPSVVRQVGRVIEDMGIKTQGQTHGRPGGFGGGGGGGGGGAF